MSERNQKADVVQNRVFRYLCICLQYGEKYTNSSIVEFLNDEAVKNQVFESEESLKIGGSITHLHIHIFIITLAKKDPWSPQGF